MGLDVVYWLSGVGSAQAANTCYKCGVEIDGSWFRIGGKCSLNVVYWLSGVGFCKAADAQDGECRAASTIAPGGNVCLWSTEPHRLKIYLKMRSTSGELADCLEGRKSNGGGRRTFRGLVVKPLLGIQRTAKSSPINYPW